MLDKDRIDELFRRLALADPEQGREPSAKLGRAPFESLVGVMLSAQSRDAMTARAKRQLLERAPTPEAILALDETAIAALIKDCGLYNMKARNLKRMCAALLERHGGVVPKAREELMALPGVGRKCADIMLRFVYGEAVVPVDTHVFRVARRTGLAVGRTEAALAAELASRVPERWRWGAHMWLLNHGKRICVARVPRCSQCLLDDLCEHNGVTTRG